MPPKTVLVTGCSVGGIGYALTQEFQKSGLTVFATARDTSKMSGLEKLPNTTVLALDVTSPSSIANVVEQVKITTGGKLDYLVNNSGQNLLTPILDTDIEAAKNMFEVNFWGILRTVQAFAPLLIEAKGTIVNIGSIVAYLHSPFMGIYNASKAAVHMFDETLRVELGPLGVRVLTVVTGSIETQINQNAPRPILPSTSKYHPAEKYLDMLSAGGANFPRMKPEVFASRVVGDVLNGATGKIWRGTNSTTTRYVSQVMPMWAQDMILTNGTGLDKVGKFTS